MSLSASGYASTFVNYLTSVGFSGPDTPTLGQVLGQGFVASVAGKSFTTADTGLISGTGKGQGVGLIGIIPGVVSGLFMTKAVSLFNSSGPDLIFIATAIELALISELTKSTLTSDHTPVFSGVGNIVPGSIPVDSGEWSSNIENFGLLQSFIGPDWGNFAKAAGFAQVAGFQTVTGIVAITGSGAPGNPGSGVGQGIIS